MLPLVLHVRLVLRNNKLIAGTENDIYGLSVKCQDIDNPSLTVKSARSSITLQKFYQLSSELIFKCLN